ncbi:MAG: ribonuclease H-like domain-containing protein [Planctomycetota bacterium]
MAVPSDDALFARLRRLRREPPPDAEDAQADAPGEAGASEPAEADVPIWLRRRMQARRRLGFAEEVDPTPSAPVSLEPPARLREERTDAGDYALRLDERGRDAEHGAVRLDEVAAVAPDAYRRFARDGGLDAIDLGRAVYLDIETTGLSGGAGTYPFLVALGRFTDGGFEVWQGFLRSPDEEPAMLHAAAERIGAASAIVSFFGKSFDRHRLEDKMRLHGVEPPFEGRPHLDLYHPCARLYRDGFPDGRLCTMERELCGVRREDDLPGAYAPAAWFDFLAGRPHRLEAVFRHNLDDVLSLVTLAAHLGRVAEETSADGQALPGPAGLRALGLARLAADRGERDEALLWIERAIQRLDGPLRGPRTLRADLRRLTGDHERARGDYEALAEEAVDEHAVHALLQLAKDAEHRRRDLPAAAALCARARVLLEEGCTGRGYARHRRDLEKRAERLRTKLDRS